MAETFNRKHKENRPVVAICYDFDKTLSPDDMQAQGYIQSVGYGVPEFWKKSNDLAAQNDMDQNLAYMYLMLQESEGRMAFTKAALAEYGAKVKLFPGVDTWFERIKRYGEEKGVIVEHYIISSGLKEMIEGTEVAKRGAFEKIYASAFYYNERGAAKWPAQVVNYTNKTQFLFRIEKGVLDINDPGVNDFFRPEEIRVPFRNIIYIGDSDTDIPCMKLVNTYGGHSIGVYNLDTKEKAKVYKMMRDNRIKYFAPSNYTEGSELDQLVKAIIERTSANEALEAIHFSCKKAFVEEECSKTNEEKRHMDLIIALGSSDSFSTTHTLIKELQKISDWTAGEKEELFKVGIENRQVRLILSDFDIKAFYRKLLLNMSSLSDAAQEIKLELEIEPN